MWLQIFWLNSQSVCLNFFQKHFIEKYSVLKGVMPLENTISKHSPFLIIYKHLARFGQLASMAEIFKVCIVLPISAISVTSI